MRVSVAPQRSSAHSRLNSSCADTEQGEAPVQSPGQRQQAGTEAIGLVGRALDVVGAIQGGEQGGTGRARHLQAPGDGRRTEPVVLTGQQVQAPPPHDRSVETNEPPCTSW